MEIVINFLREVPDAVWAAVIASLITLSGVLLTNRHYSRQTQQQLDHEKAVKDLELKFELRRSVYLQAAEEFQKAIRLLTDLATVDFSSGNPAGGADHFMVAVTKASLVAGDETAACLQELMKVYVKSFFSLLKEVVPIQNARIERDIQNSQYERYQGEVNRLIAAMNRFREEARTDQAAWNGIINNFDHNMEQARLASEARSKAWDEMNSYHASYVKKALAEAIVISKATLPAMVALRKELGINTNIDQYKKAAESMQSEVMEQIDMLIKELSEDSA